MVENLQQLERFSSVKFSRVYFGSETCERKIPTVNEARKARHFCKKNSLGFSLLTPFATDTGLKRLKSLFSLLSSEDEIIANDFGVLMEASKHKPVVVAGRLLNKQFRDPRIASFRGKFPSEMVEHLSLSQACSLGFRELLLSLGVKRVELDNLLQDIGTDLSGTGMSASIYHPVVFVSATRMCLLAGCGKISAVKKVGIFECSRECNDFRFRLGSGLFPSKLLLLGNALFFENRKLPKESALASKGIDRLVINRALAQSE